MADVTGSHPIHAICQAALSAADPFEPVRGALGERPAGRVGVVSVGKAAGRMAEAAEAAWGPLEGICVVPEGYERPLQSIRTMLAAHPVPRATSLEAAQAALALAADLGPEDTLLCLVSGGGSALLSKPADGLAFERKTAIIKELLDKGARIQDLNAVRKALSGIKGGRLAAATTAQVKTLLVSDVVGDDPAVIASGPTVQSAGASEDALEVLARYGVTVGEDITAVIRTNPLPRLGREGEALVVVRPIDVVVRAAEAAQVAGYQPLILGDALEGDAFSLGQALGGLARSIAVHGLPLRPPVAIISGGETTAPVRPGGGRGGRNTTCALGFLHAAAGLNVSALFIDTDGVDGKSGGAGAICSPGLFKIAARETASLLAANAASASADWLEAHDALFRTGPTCTNTNDLRVVLVEAPAT